MRKVGSTTLSCPARTANWRPPVAANNDSKSKSTPPADSKATKPEPGDVQVLSSAKRDGKTVQVLTDGVRTWKETK